MKGMEILLKSLDIDPNQIKEGFEGIKNAVISIENLLKTIDSDNKKILKLLGDKNGSTDGGDSSNTAITRTN